MATTYNMLLLGSVFAYLCTTNFAKANLFMPTKRMYFCLEVSSENVPISRKFLDDMKISCHQGPYFILC